MWVFEQYGAQVGSMFKKVLGADEDEEDSGEFEQQSLASNVLVTLIVALLLFVVFLFLAGISMKGLTKIIESNACKSGKMPSSWSYLLWNVLNSMTFGLVGLGGALKNDPWAACGVEPSRTGPLSKMTQASFQQVMRLRAVRA